jgi:hypothetical protein
LCELVVKVRGTFSEIECIDLVLGRL